MKQENISWEGTITNDLSNGIFEVSLHAKQTGEYNGIVIRATIGGKLRAHNIRLNIQDRVKVEMSPYDLTLGRIVYRYNVDDSGQMVQVKDRKKKGKNGMKKNR